MDYNNAQTNVGKLRNDLLEGIFGEEYQIVVEEAEATAITKGIYPKPPKTVPPVDEAGFLGLPI